MSKKGLLFLIISFFVFTINVNAMTIKPTGVAKGARGGSVDIYLTLSRSDTEKCISAVDGVLTFDSNVFTYKSHSNLMASSNWTELSGISNGKPFSYANFSFNNLIKDTTKNIVKITLDINANAPFGITNITVNNPSATDEDGNGVLISGGRMSFKIASTINTLSEIKIDGEIVNGFNSATTTYTKTIPSDKTEVELSAIATDKTATLAGIGKKKLQYGLNTFKIIVTSESGAKKEYVIKITREDDRSKVNTLKSLSLSEGEINFKPTTKTYNVIIDKNITKIKIDALLTSEKSTFVKGYGPREVTLKEGLNTYYIKVKAENDAENTYTLKITRGEKEETNDKIKTNIKELKIENHPIHFSNDVYEYDVEIIDEKSLNFTIILENDKANYEIIDNKDLIEGSIVTVKVTAEDKKTTKEYKFNIKNKAIIDENPTDEKENEKNELPKPSEESKDNNLLYICIAVFVVGVIVIIAAIIYSNNKKRETV